MGMELVLSELETQLNPGPNYSVVQGLYVTSTQKNFTITRGDFTMVGGSTFDTDQFIIDPIVNYYKRMEYQDSSALLE